MSNIYLDYNATTPILQTVKDAVGTILDKPLNASSVHSDGRFARKLIEDSRGMVRQMVGADEDTRIIFTASGTEANNQVFKGLKAYAPVVSAVEHISVLRGCQNPYFIPVDQLGLVKLDALERLLREVEGKVLVSVMLANNETGVIQPIKEIAALAHNYGAIVHTDAIQACGRIDIDMEALGVDLITVSGHKIGGLQGAGALIVKKSVALQSFITGGGQEQGYRAGTENVPAIVGFGVAAEYVGKKLLKKKTLRDMMEARLLCVCPEIKIFGQEAARINNTSCFTMPGVASETQLMHFDLEGISVSNGSACSSGKVSASHVLLAMGVDDRDASCALRVSLGNDTNERDVLAFVDAWTSLYARVHNQDTNLEGDNTRFAVA